MVYRTGDVRGTLLWLAPLAVVLASPGLALGLGMWRRLTGSEHGPLSTAALALAVFSGAVMTASIAIAWPHTGLLIAVSVLSGLILSASAAVFGIGAGYALAGLHFAWAWGLAGQLVRGSLPLGIVSGREIVAAIGSGWAGVFWQPLAVILGTAAGALWVWGRRSEARWIAGTAAAVSAASLMLIGWFGLGPTADAIGAAWFFGAYGLGLMLLGMKAEQRGIAVAGTVLLLIASVQACVYEFTQYAPQLERWAVAMLVHATVVTLMPLAGGQWLGLRNRKIGETLQQVSIVTAVASAVLIVVMMFSMPAMPIAVLCCWLAGVWIVKMTVEPRLEWLNAAEVAVFAAAFWGVVSLVETTTGTSRPRTRGQTRDSCRRWELPRACSASSRSACGLRIDGRQPAVKSRMRKTGAPRASRMAGRGSSRADSRSIAASL